MRRRIMSGSIEGIQPPEHAFSRNPAIKNRHLHLIKCLAEAKGDLINYSCCYPSVTSLADRPT
jgi:hypothetical protein